VIPTVFLKTIMRTYVILNIYKVHLSHLRDMRAHYNKVNSRKRCWYTRWTWRGCGC